MDQKLNQPPFRVFLAVPLSDFEVEVSALIGELRRKYPKIRWVAPGQIHVTLHFFGNIYPDDVSRITQCVLPIAERTPPLEAGLGGLGAFPNLDRPQVVWLDVSGADRALTEFRHRIEKSLAEAGFSTEGRKFKPHLTLGRVKENISCSDLKKILFKPTPVRKIREVILFQSRLTVQGPVYNALETYSFAKT